METKFGVHSEVGQLRKVMVCAPGRAHQRLTPSNCDQLLFDDALWVENAKRDHFDFMQKMRDRGDDVVEMDNELAETLIGGLSTLEFPESVGGKALQVVKQAAGVTEYLLPPLPNTLYTRDT